MSSDVWEPVLPGAGLLSSLSQPPELRSSGDLVKGQPAFSRLQTCPTAFLPSFLTSKPSTGHQAKAVSSGHSASHHSLCPELTSFTLKVRGFAGVSQPCCNQSFGCGLVVPPPLCLDFPLFPPRRPAPLGEPRGPLLPGCLPLLAAPSHRSGQKAARAELSLRQRRSSLLRPHKFPPVDPAWFVL